MRLYVSERSRTAELIRFRSAAPYVLGMLLSGEFESPGVALDKSQIPIDLDEAKWRVERAAYLNCGPAQYKMVCCGLLELYSSTRMLTLVRLQGYAYEYATLSCLFDPLLSVQYYALGEHDREIINANLFADEACAA